jgi:signal transduction histidine kinase
LGSGKKIAEAISSNVKYLAHWQNMEGSSRFFNIFSVVDKWLIPNHLKGSLFQLRKARVLMAIHLFLFVITAIFVVANTFVFHNMETPPLAIGMLVDFLLIYIFQRWGNFIISGNLLALVIFMVLVSTIGDTGGLYSDNLLWLVMVPLLALLFANRWSGFFWLAALECVAFYFFLAEKGAAVSFRERTLQFDELYYFTTYAGLFLMVVGIVLIFATGQEMIIRALHEKQMELSRQKAELARQTLSQLEAEQKLLTTNRELEQFAYAASHDLKEPLRMIGSYIQLIKRKMNAQLDGPTQEYMGYVTDGVSRMEKLLNDLLEYSRLGRRKEQVRDVDLNEIMLVVINNLMAGMKETHAAIYVNQLPVIKASYTEMTQLFQNLISNSIKFRKAGESPMVEIAHEMQDETHVFHFHDNGIGIPEEDNQRVFNIFERLHARQDYEGSGIGLATCKKIISNLGGRIWVESGVGEGATFSFTIPKD